MNCERPRFLLWHRPAAMSLLAGLLMGFSYPPVDAAILQIPAMILFFRISAISATIREAILTLTPGLLIWNLAVAHWLLLASPAGGLAVNVSNALFMLIPFLLIRPLFRNPSHPILTAVTASAIWCSFEFFHHNWQIAYPWLTLGNGWANLTGAIQYISMTGVIGISFWIVLTSALLFRFIMTQERNLFRAAAFVFFLFPVLSVSATFMADFGNDTEIEVAVLQPDTNSNIPHGDYDSAEELGRSLLERSSRIITPGTDLILWPENSIDIGMTDDHPILAEIRDSLRTWNTELLFGGGFVDLYENDPPHIHRLNRDSEPFNIFNAAFFMDGNNGLRSIYRKKKLVPFYERIPYIDILSRADLFRLVNWGEISGYGRGMDAGLFESGQAQAGVMICYDTVFPGLGSELARSGAGFLTIITNDGWWGDSIGHVQHFAYARLRAIEQRRWIVRSANNGISGVISPDGKVQISTDYGTDDAFRFIVHSSESVSLYARYGSVLYMFLLMMAGGGSVALYFLRRTPS